VASAGGAVDFAVPLRDSLVRAAALRGRRQGGDAEVHRGGRGARDGGHVRLGHGLRGHRGDHARRGQEPQDSRPPLLLRLI